MEFPIKIKFENEETIFSKKHQMKKNKKELIKKSKLNKIAN